jgi:hypothetical protein
LKKTHILNTIYTSVLPLSSFQQEDLEMIDRSNFHHHHHHERSYSINCGGGEGKQHNTKQNKQTYVNFEKTYVTILQSGTA